ncbi:MAG: DUF485 domain-containing protein [Austwickia sp.]|nr:DUF485 domain-containing protein [Austwickia sp.]MBK8437789.1 DUF485 domain-containing protein [Austwickia sp.]MBK9100097.1 DUF485 domain-containing protein [Austwickia sp.]
MADADRQNRDAYLAVQRAPEFVELRRRFRAFVFPATAFFLAWYFLYVLLAAYAPGLMNTPIIGNINVALVFGLLQFVTTFAITIVYVRWADREFDPRADKIRHDMESGALSSSGDLR